MTTTVELIHPGYIRDEAASAAASRSSATATRSSSPTRDGRASLARSSIRSPRAGVAGGASPTSSSATTTPTTRVNIALFPNAEVVDFWARYRDDLWLDHDGDG